MATLLAVGRKRTMVKRHSFSELIDSYLIAVLYLTTEGDEEINDNFNTNASAIVDTNTKGDISPDLHEDRDLDKDSRCSRCK